MGEDSPRVSVLMAAHDAASTIGRAIDSCVQQTFADWELIVVDDASSDDTSSVVQACEDPRVRLITFERNQGPGAARNAAIAASRGAWLAVLDADDAFLPNRLERLHGLAEQLDPWCVLADRSLRVAHSEQGFVPLEQIPETIPVGHSVIAPAQVLQKGAGGKPFFSRVLLETSQARYPVGVISAEDIAFLLLLLRAERARFVRLRDPHYLYAVQEGSLTTSTERYCDRLAALAPLADDDRMPPDLRASIARHLDEVQLAQPFEELRGALRSRRPLQAATIVARHPRILLRLPALYRTHRRYRSAVSDARRFADQASAEGRAPEGSR